MKKTLLTKDSTDFRKRLKQHFWLDLVLRDAWQWHQYLQGKDLKFAPIVVFSIPFAMMIFILALNDALIEQWTGWLGFTFFAYLIAGQYAEKLLGKAIRNLNSAREDNLLMCRGKFRKQDIELIELWGGDFWDPRHPFNNPSSNEYAEEKERWRMQYLQLGPIARLSLIKCALHGDPIIAP